MIKINMEIEDLRLNENKSKEMIEAYIRYNLKMFKIRNIQVENSKVSRENK